MRMAKVNARQDHEIRETLSRSGFDYGQVLRKQRLIEVDGFWRGLQVVDFMERETGLEPATSSLGS